MKKLLFTLFLLSFTTIIFSQYEVTIEAYVLDKNTNSPIPYVNIGFVNKSIGTVSSTDGKFILIYHEDVIGGKEFLQFSALGYKTLKVRVSQLVPFLNNTNKFYLIPEPIELEEIFITNKIRNKKRIGNTKIVLNMMGYWKDEDALGGEITTKIKIKTKQTKLLDLKFNIIENTSDSLKVRVNVYKYKKNYPQENILSANIFHIIKTKKGEESIDLRPYNIEVNDDVVIGIELVKVYGKDINFAISAAKGLSFLRLISQDKWTRYSNIGMNFTILTSFPVSATDNVSNSREQPKKITLYYDVSKHMKKRFSKQEFNLLSKYLAALKEVEIKVIKFNNARNNARIFNVLKGNTSELISYLQNSEYDGASDFKSILKTNTFNADVILLFSSGINNFFPLQSEVYIPTFCINSLSNANHLALQKTAQYADGHYINLSKISSNQGLDYMTNKIEDNEIYINVNENEVIEKNLLYGKVFYAAGLIQGATIRVKNTFIESQSDAFGYFKIKAKEDDILVVNYFGMEEKEVLISNSKEIYILMKPVGELLDEVSLKGKIKKEDDVLTGFGKSSKDAVGYSINTITSKDIKPHHTTLVDVIRGNFAGIRLVNLDPNNPKFIIRGKGSINYMSFAIFDIDGIIYTDNPPYVNPQDIESITILKSLAATVKYGGEGNGGVIKIVTKFMTRGKGEMKINSALIKGNDYIENGILLIESVIQSPSYLREFEAATSYKNALTIYSKHLQQKTVSSTPYYLDVSDYFKKWNKDKAYTILSNIASVAYNNPKALTTLAYKLEELEKFEQAKHIYKRIIELRPNDAQPYRDLALSYITTGYYTEAMELYGKMLNDQIENVDFKGLKKVITSEFRHLLVKHRSKINYSNVHADYLRADFKYDMRIVFEWNDPNTEFELQFVNPQNKFFKWSHTYFENKERILDEINLGYHIKEFIIDDAVSGEWIINIECLSKADILNPAYLKYTVYKNYGLTNETKTIKVIKLDKQLQKVTLDKFLYK